MGHTTFSHSTKKYSVFVENSFSHSQFASGDLKDPVFVSVGPIYNALNFG